MLATASLFAAGWILYTWVEYAVHRWGGHSPRWQRGWRAHLEHHSHPRTFPGAHVVLGLAFIPISALSFALLSVAAASGFLGGSLFGWALFEYTHRTLHNSGRAPRTAYGRWIARNHLHHHFENSRTNHGITSPLWDLLLGTYERVDTVVVKGHPRTVPPWLESCSSRDDRILLAARDG